MKTKEFNKVKPYCYILTRLSDGMKYHGLRWDNVAKKITPVPGGVGPMTIACLMHNTVKAAYKNKKQNFKNILGDYF